MVQFMPALRVFRFFSLPPQAPRVSAFVSAREFLPICPPSMLGILFSNRYPFLGTSESRNREFVLVVDGNCKSERRSSRAESRCRCALSV
jgi:hypothetical protein